MWSYERFQPMSHFICIHVLELVKKASCRLYFLRQLKRSQVIPAELILFYITCIRSILECACPVFHRALPGYLSEDLERLQKRALRIIYPGMSYNQALEFSGLPTLFERREEISSKLFTNSFLPRIQQITFWGGIGTLPYLCARPIDEKNLSFLVTFSALSSV